MVIFGSWPLPAGQRSRFARNRCDPTGPDVGGAAIRVLDQYHDRPVRAVRSSFEGGVCSNSGALSSIGVSRWVTGSVMTGNRAVGRGANPVPGWHPDCGSGGAIYADGNRFTVRIVGSRIEGNRVREGSGAILFVSNDRAGTLRIERSMLRRNPNAGFATRGFPAFSSSVRESRRWCRPR
ncbi:hypothetical protein HCN51_51360 [Nonomuraea sp. FMUSA5-5]|uniref:Right-handed parallel beta-helix repeat-containing protein n=1 Tax=Nonomuraea composti TaxID=2720023 RepID=A0ABX1BJ38_9ACTN|nr:hypothetical protein [Nonomuraea sp. FMUSA5-5]NJP97734.1 hypothetical protein [Nonomuraea sp. FMUSA5-5]